jgi:hypothetical protein
VLQEAAERNDCPAGGDYPAREFDGVVRVGAEVVFHRDVLKGELPKLDVSGEMPVALTKTQMSLDLRELG